jgi:hypothetical protein
MTTTQLLIAQLGHAAQHLDHLRRTLPMAAGTPTPAATPVAPLPTKSLNTDGVVNFLGTKVAPILLGILGVVFLARANRGETSKVITSSAIAIIGLAFIAGAASLFFFGGSIINLIFS